MKMDGVRLGMPKARRERTSSELSRTSRTNGFLRLLTGLIVLLLWHGLPARGDTAKPAPSEVKGMTVPPTKKIGVSFELTYLSEWLSKGAEAYGQHGAWFETIDLDFWGSGFGVDVTHRSATESGYVDKQRIDYRPYYKGVMFEEERFQTNFMFSTEYEHYYGLDRHKAYTTWEWINSFSWPKLLPKGFTPTYIMHYEYPACKNARYTYHSMEGWVHRFILGYDLKVPELQNPVKLTSEVAYTDGLGRAQHDWSYATFGLSTKFNINKNMTFTPAIYQQVTMDHSVCKHKDVTYCTLSMKYTF